MTSISLGLIDAIWSIVMSYLAPASKRVICVKFSATCRNTAVLIASVNSASQEGDAVTTEETILGYEPLIVVTL